MSEERYVSFLDILGFSNMIRENDLDFIIRKFEAVLYFLPHPKALGKYVKLEGETNQGVKKCSCFSFSDTFVLSTEDTSDESFNNITIATFLLARSLFGVGLPVRGAITRGEADCIPNTNHLLGKAIIGAKELEEKQDWFGIILSPDVLSVYDVIPSGPIEDILVEYQVPLKECKDTPFVVINWRLNLDVEHGIESLFPNVSDHRQLRKKMNTLKFEKYINDSGKAYRDVKEKWQHKIRISDRPQVKSQFVLGHDF